MARVLVLPLLVATVLQSSTAALDESKSPVVLPRAHAHNDYYHDRPLLDALDHGFCSIEADIFLVEGKLLVGHARWELQPERTLQALYLDPLLQRSKSNGGWVFAKKQPITLLVDIKSDGEATYRVLREALKPYRQMLSHVKDGEYHRNAVELVLSGDRPHELVAAPSERYVFLDGRVNEITAATDPNLVPLVSENWNNHFSWRGQGPMPADQREKLRSLVQQLHSQKRRLRFWATPELPEFWEQLAQHDVDLIGTDELGKLQTYLVERNRLSQKPPK